MYECICMFESTRYKAHLSSLEISRVFRWAATPITQQLHNGGTVSDVDLTLVQAMTQMADQKLFMVHQ